MKTFILLILLLLGGFAFWKFSESENPAISEKVNRPAGSILHTVVKGDTLHSIARSHRTTVKSIQQLNRLDDTTILIGDSLVVMPGKKSSTPAAQPSVPKAVVVTDPQPPKPKQPTKPVTRKNLPKSAVMESSKIAIDIDAKNQVYLKNADGKFAPAGTIIYGSDADANGNEVKTITYRDLKGRETTLPGGALPESVIRLALKKK